jgi:myo-inositol 2-dehydrogenase/D-chiro-inositol 1-dehydrogenase
MLSIAVIGGGRIGRIHAANIASSQHARLAGVADADPALATISLDAAFQADAVLIASPTPTHAGYIERAAAAGKPVFCEKPIDLDSVRVRACLAAVERAGIPLMVGFNRRFDPSFAALQSRLAGGEIGALELLTIISKDPSPPPAAYVAVSGGIFRDMMIHDLDMACFLMGAAPVWLSAAGSKLVQPDGVDFDTATVTLRTASGQLCVITNSRRATYGYDQRIEAHGARGMLKAGNMTSTTVQSATAAGFTGEPALPFFLERYAAAYRLELAAFIDCVSTGRSPHPNGEDGLRALELADAATLSAQTGEVVRLS